MFHRPHASSRLSSSPSRPLSTRVWRSFCAVLIILGVFIAIDGLLPVFLKFLFAVQLPMTVMLVAIWGWVAKAPPGMPMGSDPAAGVRFALLISLRLAVLGGAFQLIMLSIPSRLLPATLRGWGLRGEGLVVALGVFAVEPELKLRRNRYLSPPRSRAAWRQPLGRTQTTSPAFAPAVRLVHSLRGPPRKSGNSVPCSFAFTGFPPNPCHFLPFPVQSRWRYRFYGSRSRLFCAGRNSWGFDEPKSTELLLAALDSCRILAIDGPNFSGRSSLLRRFCRINSDGRMYLGPEVYFALSGLTTSVRQELELHAGGNPGIV